VNAGPAVRANIIATIAATAINKSIRFKRYLFLLSLQALPLSSLATPTELLLVRAWRGFGEKARHKKQTLIKLLENDPRNVSWNTQSKKNLPHAWRKWASRPDAARMLSVCGFGRGGRGARRLVLED